MMKEFNRSILEVVGNTPIVKLQSIGKELSSSFYVKCEFMNPGGSIKDRIGKYMCEQAMKRGQIKKGGIIIEATSGNTGIGIAIFAALNQCQAIFVMADKQSKEKIEVLKAFGAQVIVCPTNVEPEDPSSYYSVSQKIADSIPNSFYANQYINPDNYYAHYYSTGPEIYNQTLGQFDYFVAGVGTGGTISGTGAYLKEKMPNVKILGIDIEGSVLAEYHRTGKLITPKPYVVEGIGDGFLPENVKFNVIDEFEVAQDEESFVMTRRLLQEEGIYCGGSCGSAVVGALKHAKKSNHSKDYLIILPDSGSRYLSKVHNSEWMNKMNYPVGKQPHELIQKLKTILVSGVKIA